MVVNGGDTSTVKVGNDKEFKLNTVKNPVPDEPSKKETDPYQGTGVLGAVKVGDEITYEISYKNYKTRKADITIKDELDHNVEFVAASDHGTCTDADALTNGGGTVTWTIKDVEAGASGKVTVTVKVRESALTSLGGKGKVVNGGKTATVQVGNDQAFELDVVENPVPETPVKVEKSPDTGVGTLAAVKVGDQITYEISYRNYKAEKASVTIKDTLDENVKFVGADHDGACSGADARTNGGGTVTWTIRDVEPDTDGKVTLKVEVLEGEEYGGIEQGCLYRMPVFNLHGRDVLVQE